MLFQHYCFWCTKRCSKCFSSFALRHIDFRNGVFLYLTQFLSRLPLLFVKKEYNVNNWKGFISRAWELLLSYFPLITGQVWQKMKNNGKKKRIILAALCIWVLPCREQPQCHHRLCQCHVYGVWRPFGDTLTLPQTFTVKSNFADHGVFCFRSFLTPFILQKLRFCGMI